MPPIRTVVVPTDFSEITQHVLEQAIALCALDGGTIHLIHTIRLPALSALPPSGFPGGLWEAIHESARAQMAALAKEVEGRGVAVTTECVDAQDPANAVLDCAEREQADWIVMGTHGHTGLAHAILGSVAERTVRAASQPVLSVKEDCRGIERPAERLLIATDFSAHAERATEVAADYAVQVGAHVHLLHAFEIPGDYVPYTMPMSADFGMLIQSRATEALERTASKLRASGLAVEEHLRRGRPSKVVLEEADRLKVPLIAMGTRGAGGLAHLLVGSVAEHTLRMAPCAVLTVRASDEDAG
jgi:nucleotide-binding universal stress UspA family protein